MATLLEEIKSDSYQARVGRGTAFGDRIININQIAKAQGLCQSRLSRAFRGERPLHLSDVLKLSAYLGMPVEEFIETFESRLHAIKKTDDQTLEDYEVHIEGEDQANLARVRAGRATIPSLPGLRA